MKKYFFTLLGGVILAFAMSISANAETSITDVLPKGATTVFYAKYQSASKGDGDWPSASADNWYAKDFDDSSWDTKKVPFGSGLSGDQNWAGEYNCYWLRINFNLDAVDNTATYYFLCRHDDTYKAYINGNLIADRNGWTGDGYCYVPIDNSYLSAGTNVIAVYIQQNYGGAYFDCGVQKYNYQESDFDTSYQGVEVADGEFYLYNPASGLWLQNSDRISSDWNTRGELGTRGLDFTLTKQNNGGYYLNGKFGKNTLNAGNRYLDTNCGDAWHFEKVNVPGFDNAYKITYWPTDQNDYTLSGSEQTPGHKSNNMFTPSSNIYLDCLRTKINDYSIWVLVTKAQRLAMMQTGTSTSPQDATWLIKNADFADNDERTNAWEKTNDSFIHNFRGDWDDSRNGRVYESYNTENVEFKQTINLPAGNYRMRVQGFYRSGEAKMFAGSTKQALLSSDTQEQGWTVARSMYNSGAYIGNWMAFTHDGGDLTIGIEKGAKAGETDWIVFSKFALEYLGNGDVLNATIKVCEAQNTNNDPAFAAAISEAKNSTSEDRAAVLEKLRTARNLYAMGYHEDVFTGAEVAAGDFFLYNVGAKRFLCGYGNWGTHAAVGYTARPVTLISSNNGQWRIQTHLPNGNEGTNDFLGYNGFVDTDATTTWAFQEVSPGIYRIARTLDNNTVYLGYNAAAHGDFYTVDSDCSGADNVNNHWKLVTKAERDALLDNASESNPVDATYYIKRPGYDNREGGWTLWSENNYGDNGVYDAGGSHRSFVWQTWDAAQVNHYQDITGLRPGIYEVSVQGFYRWGDTEQTVAEKNDNNNVVQGAYLYAYGKGGSENEQRSFLMSILDEQGKLPGIGTNFTVDGITAELPVNCYDQSMNYFEAGLYNNKLRVQVGADGNLRIGIYKTQNNKAHDWVVLDNWRLKYLGSAVPVSVSSYGIATFSSSHDLDFEGSGITPYRADKVNGGNIVFKKIESMQVPANTGVLLKSEGEKNMYVPIISGAAAVEDNLMKPSVAATTLTGGTYFVLAKKEKDSSPLFYQAESGYVSGAGKAYLEVPASSSRLAISFDDETTTGIYQMEDGRWKMEDSVFDLQGRKFDGSRLKGQGSRLNPGLYIINGKKQVVK